MNRRSSRLSTTSRYDSDIGSSCCRIVGHNNGNIGTLDKVDGASNRNTNTICLDWNIIRNVGLCKCSGNIGGLGVIVRPQLRDRSSLEVDVGPYLSDRNLMSVSQNKGAETLVTGSIRFSKCRGDISTLDIDVGPDLLDRNEVGVGTIKDLSQSYGRGICKSEGTKTLETGRIGL